MTLAVDMAAIWTCKNYYERLEIVEYSYEAIGGSRGSTNLAPTLRGPHLSLIKKC